MCILYIRYIDDVVVGIYWDSALIDVALGENKESDLACKWVFKGRVLLKCPQIVCSFCEGPGSKKGSAPKRAQPQKRLSLKECAQIVCPLCEGLVPGRRMFEDAGLGRGRGYGRTALARPSGSLQL